MSDKFSKVDSFVGNTSNPAHLFLRPCPLCGGERSRKVWGVRDFQFFSDSSTVSKRAEITDVQCRDCLCLYRNPCFTEVGFMALFEEAGCSYGATEPRPQEQIEWLATRGLLEPGKVFLDVGCYDGKFLSNLPSVVERVGVDVDAPAIARGRQRDPGISLYHSSFETFKPNEQPDVITMFHVLEHLASPKAVLTQLAEISSKDAVLVVEVPTLERGSTNDINGFFSVQHLTHFSENTLSEILKASGWQISEHCNMESYNGRRVLAKKSECLSPAVSAQHSDSTALSQVLRNWENAINAAKKHLSTLPAEGRFVIWGGGMHTEVLYQQTDFFAEGGRRFLIVDTDPLKHSKTWRGVKVGGPSELMNIADCFSHIVVSSYGNQRDILASAKSMGFPTQRLIHLYESIDVY